MSSETIEEVFASCKSKGKTAFIPYVTAGYPSKASTVPLLLALQKGGADIVELGVPFSDPLADGETIQRANTEALKNGVTLKDCITYVADARKAGFTKPVVLMGYFNPFLKYGAEKLLKECNEVGIHGLIVVDLLFGEAGEFIQLCRKYSVNFIPLVAPTSTDERIAKIAKITSGYVYCVSLTGVTGARTSLPVDLQSFVARVKKFIKKPIAIGFGYVVRSTRSSSSSFSQSDAVRSRSLSTRQHYLSVGKLADGVIMGSAIVRTAATKGDTVEESAKRLEKFVQSIVTG